MEQTRPLFLRSDMNDYLIQALISYRTGTRSNPIMNGFAANLSNESMITPDIEDIAAFYSELDSQPMLFTPTNG